jgi:hypothetical protein
MRKITARSKLLIPAVLAVAAFAVPSVASGDSTKTCTETGQPHKNFTTTSTQTSACNSNSSVNQSPQTVSNGGGNQPPGQQP